MFSPKWAIILPKGLYNLLRLIIGIFVRNIDIHEKIMFIFDEVASSVYPWYWGILGWLIPALLFMVGFRKFLKNNKKLAHPGYNLFQEVPIIKLD